MVRLSFGSARLMEFKKQREDQRRRKQRRQRCLNKLVVAGVFVPVIIIVLSSLGIRNMEALAAMKQQQSKIQKLRIVPSQADFLDGQTSADADTIVQSMVPHDGQPKANQLHVMEKEGKRDFVMNESNEKPSSNEHQSSDAAQPCNFHGNCPQTTICVPNESGTISNGYDGKCLPYHDDIETLSKDLLQKCHDACFEELYWDEHYFQESHATVLKTSSASYGHGCILTYERLPGIPLDFAQRSKKSIDEWVASRYHRLIRVDPVLDSTDDIPGHKEAVMWQALCGMPCDTDSDCEDSEKMVCSSKREHERPVAPHPSHPEISIAWMRIDHGKKTCRHKSRVELAEGTKSNSEEKRMILVSGANGSYFKGLKNLAHSLKFWEPDRKIVVYNLGMSNQQLTEIQTWSNLEELRWPNGIPKDYPIHVQRNAKNYAWKPILINEVVRDYGSIFWLDAGATLTGPMGPVEEIVRQTGLFLVHGQDEDMQRMAHPGTYAWHGYDKTTFVGGPHCGGNTQGHTYPSPYMDSIVVPNAECSLDAACITPNGASLSNHRFDQTSLSILAYNPAVRAPHYTEFVAASRSQLPKSLRIANRIITWTARQGCDTFKELVSLVK